MFFAKADASKGSESPVFPSASSQECLSMTAGQLSAPDTELCHCHPPQHPLDRSANPQLSEEIKIKGGEDQGREWDVHIKPF